ncbi:hypothetical protein, partial [Burkholderia multivorans]|uniref:hypothetical protein n=1 Tax=Burkholderia multivorans TaxID=87883 RepID=UPI001C65FD2D
MVGYCAIGNVKIAATPASIRMMAITHAKIGRSIKNFAMKQAPCYCAPEAAADDPAAALAGAPDAPALDAAAADAAAAEAGAAAAGAA